MRRPYRAVAGFLLLAAIGLAGCAYEVGGNARALDPGRVSRLRKVSVAPFRYRNDWTGYFRDIYRKAGVEPPSIRKAEKIEATFLIEDALSERGFELLSWPKGAGEVPASLRPM